MTDYKDIDDSMVQDIAKRTLVNLKFVEAQYKLYKDGYSTLEVYEITQLINSFLGLLIFPKEEFWDRLKCKNLSEVPFAKEFIQEQELEAKNLKDLIRHIRNSISHFTKVEIKYAVDKATTGTYIASIEMEDWDFRCKPPKMTWKAHISVFDLRDFLVDFAEHIIDGTYLDHSK